MRSISVWILPRWHDPLFVERCFVLLGVAPLVLLLALIAKQALAGCLAFVVCVWPYRHAVRVSDGDLVVRWLVFRATLRAGDLLGAELSIRSHRRAELTIQRRTAPRLMLQGAAEDLVALHVALFERKL